MTEAEVQRLDVDGGADETSPARSTEKRLVWAPASDGPHLAAAWWPRTRHDAVELVDLIEAAGAQMGGPVTRVSLNKGAWDEPHPTRLFPAGGVVRLGWFHYMDPHLVTVGRGTFHRISIAVLPADMDDFAARRLLRELQAGAAWPATPAELLAEDRIPVSAGG